jgi:large subunit ribosomal protein L15
MKLHDLRPAEGSHKARTRVGRGIAAGKGKTAGRGTKGQKARAGGSIPPWFEGGQTPLHMRIPKLRGFKNRAKIDYEIVNVGDIAARLEAGAFAAAGTAPKKGEQLTINADILRAVGLVRNVAKPLKILGSGELSTALFVVADAFTKSATAKIEAAGGAVSILEVPATQLPALGVDGEPKTRERRTAAGRAAADQEVTARARRDADTAQAEAEATAAAAKPAKATKPKAARPEPAPDAADAAADGPAAVVGSADVAELDTTDAPDAEPADAPDAVVEDATAEPPTGDDSDETSAPTGDESA